ncbi:MAG: HD domain-containing protein, partial [Desulfobacterales bacterium]|nr:HD domain-containing protein [Desulfobacterales bacterium]
MPGVEVHATIVDNILREEFFSRPKWFDGLEFFLALVSGVLSTLFLAWSRAGRSLLLLVLNAVVLWGISEWALRARGVFISPVIPLLTLGCNFSALTLLKFWREQRRVKKRTRELALTQQAIIECMTSLAEVRDPETGGHIKRTQEYVMVLAKQLQKRPGFENQLDDEYIELLYYCAPLHDIGKVGVQDKILLKPGKLNDEEYEEMKKHTVYARDAIMSAEENLGEKAFFHVARNVVYAHHEKWDGSG